MRGGKIYLIKSKVFQIDYYRWVILMIINKISFINIQFNIVENFKKRK